MDVIVKLADGSTDTFRDSNDGGVGRRESHTVHDFDIDGDVLTVRAVPYWPRTDEKGESFIVGYYKPKTWLVARAALPDE
jgi:hypothetical protein